MSGRTSFQPGPAAVHVRPVGDDQLHVTVALGERPADLLHATRALYEQVAGILNRGGMRIVHERIFGSLDARPAILQARDEALRRRGLAPERPVTFIQGRPLWGHGLAGVQIHAVRPPESLDQVWTIEDAGRPCGHGWTRHGTRFLLLQNVHGAGPAAPGLNGRAVEAERMFESARRVLRAQGADYAHVVRTWIYLSHILDWYAAFNQVRNAKYAEYGLFAPPGPPRLPASTGIEGDNPLGAACVMDVLAVVPDAPLAVEPLANVRQSEAHAYGSAFSRAMCVREPDVTHIMVSGTAAIDEEGRSLYPGDAQAQVRRTLENVAALIERRGARLQDICEATVFLKRPADAEAYRRVAADHGLADVPAVLVVADVCRDELLFELDALVEFAPAPGA